MPSDLRAKTLHICHLLRRSTGLEVATACVASIVVEIVGGQGYDYLLSQGKGLYGKHTKWEQRLMHGAADPDGYACTAQSFEL